MKFTDPFDPATLLPTRIRETPVWADFADMIQKVFGENIVDPREFLLRSRDGYRFRRGQFYRGPDGQLYRIEHVDHYTSFYPYEPVPENLILSDGDGKFYQVSGQDATNERQLLIRNAQESGFNILAERLNDEDFARLVQTLAMYYAQKGTKAFINYIGYIKNVELKATQMWAQEDTSTDAYVNMQPEPLGTTILEDPVAGTWYPTSHYRVEYDAEFFNTFNDNDFIELFLKFAPIHIVLESFSGVFNFPFTLYIGMAGGFHDSETIHMPENDYFSLFGVTLYMNLSAAGDTEVFNMPGNE